MKILVTGGCGFIGSFLVDRLVNDGHDVVVLDNLEKQVHPNGKPQYINDAANYIFADILNNDVIKNIMDSVEVVFHMASAVGVSQSLYEIEKYVKTNSLGTAKLLNFLANEEHNVKKIIVSSSMTLYGEGSYECPNCGLFYPKLRDDDQMKRKEWEIRCPKCGRISKPLPTKEDKPLNPASVYAITKRDQEELTMTIGKTYGIPTVALRYFNVYGPRQSLNNPYTGVTAIFSARLKEGKSPLIFEDGRQTRDFISVHDVIESNIMVMKNSNANYNSFNVGSGKPITILEVAKSIANLLDVKVEPKVLDEFRSRDVRHCFADISKIKKTIGFEPKISFEEGLKELVEWGKEETVNVNTDKAFEELKNKGISKI